MRKIQEILRLKYESGLSRRAIASALNIGYGTVANYLSRAKAADINWPLAADMDERTLGRLLFPSQRGPRRFSEPDHANIHLELKQKGVTLLLLSIIRDTHNNILKQLHFLLCDCKEKNLFSFQNNLVGLKMELIYDRKEKKRIIRGIIKLSETPTIRIIRDTHNNILKQLHFLLCDCKEKNLFSFQNNLVGLKMELIYDRKEKKIK